VVHRIVRNQNYQGSIYSRIGNRYNPFKNTLTVLEDPAKDRKLFLIGTTHSSTLLSYRTKELIEKEKPDALYVQTNQDWWEIAKEIKGI
jgi:hypothetical protein